MANKEDCTSEEIKAYLKRKYQYQHLLQPAITAQPFNQISVGSGREFIRNKPQPQTTGKKKFDWQGFFCGKTGHCKQECRSRIRDWNSNSVK